MEELVNFIITIVHFFKYGTKVNRNRSFKMELSTAIQIKDENLPVLQKLVNAQLSSLHIKGNGIPAYSYIEHKKREWYKVLIINREKNFFCRLEPMEIKDIELPDKCYIML